MAWKVPNMKAITFWAPLFTAVAFCGGFAVTQASYGRRLDALESSRETDRMIIYEIQGDVKAIRAIIERRQR